MATVTAHDARRTGTSALEWMLLLVPGTIWDASFLFIAEGLRAVAPNGVTFARIAVGFATLSLVSTARRPLQRRDRWKGAALGVLWMAFPLSMFPFAEQHLSSALTGMLNGATPLFAVAVACLIARRPPTRRVALGLAIGFAGAVLIALPSASLDESTTGGGSLTAILMILAALACYGISLNLARPLQLRNGALPVVWNALAVAVLLTAPLGLPAVLAGHWSSGPAAALLALGAFGTGIAYVVYAASAGRLGATRASATTFLTPVVALLLGVVFRHEQVELVSIVGAAVCLTGAWLIR